MILKKWSSWMSSTSTTGPSGWISPGHPDEAVQDGGRLCRTAWHPENSFHQFHSPLRRGGGAEDRKQSLCPIRPTASASWWRKDPPDLAGSDRARELTIVRPGIVYGKGEHGNMTRLYKGPEEALFLLRRAEGHHQSLHLRYELVRFFKYRMIDHSFPGVGLYNCTFEPVYHRGDLHRNAVGHGMKSYVPIPGKLLLFAAVLGPIGGKGWHPPGPREKADGLHQYLRQKAGRNGLPLPLYLGGKLPRLV